MPVTKNEIFMLRKSINCELIALYNAMKKIPKERRGNIKKFAELNFWLVYLRLFIDSFNIYGARKITLEDLSFINKEIEHLVIYLTKDGVITAEQCNFFKSALRQYNDKENSETVANNVTAIVLNHIADLLPEGLLINNINPAVMCSKLAGNVENYLHAVFEKFSCEEDQNQTLSLSGIGAILSAAWESFTSPSSDKSKPLSCRESSKFNHDGEGSHTSENSKTKYGTFNLK